VIDLDDEADYCPHCRELWEHCDCEPAILTALEDSVCFACGKAIRFGDLTQVWEDGRAHMACEWQVSS
jgi:hypothetical protein